MMITVVGALITIRDFLNKRSPDTPVSSETDPDEEGLSSPAEGFVRLPEDIMREAMNLLEGFFIVHDDGEIIYKGKGAPLKGDPKAMLYVFGARVAYDAGKRNSPEVSKVEIVDEMGWSSAAANVFISKMGDFIIRNFDTDLPTDLDDDEVTIELNRKQAIEAANYIRGNRGSPN